MSNLAYMNAVEWIPTGEIPNGELPWATHSGEMELFGIKLRCYRLNTGQSIINADDMNALFEAMGDSAP